MKNRMKRLSLLLALCLLLSVLPAHAAEIVDSGECGENVTWTLDSDGMLTISGTGEMTDFDGGSSPFDKNESVKKVIINAGVTSIGAYAFSYYKELTSVTIPDSVTSIGNEAFTHCTGLKSIMIPNSITSIGDSAFNNTEWFNAQPDGLLYVGKVAYKYKGEMPNNTTVNIKAGTLEIASFAFEGCSGLISVMIPDSVTTIGQGAFSRCDALTNVTIPDGVMSIGGEAFNGCTGLTSVTISDSVMRLENYVFCNCSSLMSITIPAGVTSIGDFAFIGCTELTSVMVPVGVTSIGAFAFAGCTGLTNVTVPDSVTSIGNAAFAGCTGLTSIMIPSGVTIIMSQTFDSCSGLMSVTIPSCVTSIRNGGFEGCAGLTSMIIPASVKEIGDDAIPAHTVIYGYAGSYAQTWAAENNREFRLISELIKLSAPETMTVKAGEETDIEIIADYAAGKTVSIAADNDNVTLPDSKVALDADGKATITIIGKTAGETKLIFMLDGTDKTAETKVVVSEPEPSETLPGDVSGDGEVTAEDARLALRAAVGLETYEKGSAEFLAADASRDGEITSEDARLILRAAVGLETLF